MSVPLSRLSRFAIAASLAVLCLAVRSDATRATVGEVSRRMRVLPSRTLWVWERPEDLSQVDPANTAVAFLDQTIFVGTDVISRPRRQPLAYPTSVARIAVVRIEAPSSVGLDSERRQQVVELILRSIKDRGKDPGIAALQVDFDATRSQRGWYADLLRDLRRQMPAGLPLSMTALTSWCSYDDWIAGLPVDEAVPMFFRMEPDHRRARAGSPEFLIREPLCMSSVGVSTREAWPHDMAGKRVYIFPDRGWREDFALLADRRLP